VALLFCDSCSHYSASQGPRKWERWFASGLVAGRWPGTNAISINGQQEATKTIPPRGTVIVGAALYIDSFQYGDTCIMVLDSNTVQVSVFQRTDGYLEIRRGGSTVLAVSSIPIKPAVWNYLELKATIHPSAGSAVLKVNGTQVAAVSGVNTSQTGSSQATQVGFGSQSGGPPRRVTDIYIADTTGTRNNDFLGDVRVAALLPNGAGTYTEWSTLVGAATQWQAVADNPADDDTSYIASATAGQRSTFAMADLPPISGTVAAVVINHESRKDDAGTRTIAGMARLAGVDAAGAGVNVASSYAIYQEIMETNPSGANWSIANVNAVELGVKEVA
jgi:hypothetical protein